MNHGARLSLMDRHLKGIEHELRTQMRRHRPPNDAPTKDVKHDGQEQEAAPCRDVRDIRHPKSVGSVGGEVAIDQIGSRSRVSIANGGLEAFATAGSVNMAFPHEARQAFAARSDASVAYIVGQTRSTIRRTRTFEVYFQRISDRDVGTRVIARRTLEPRIVPADRDVQHAALRSNGPNGMVRPHEFEDFPGTESVSRANHAAAFFKISRSISSSRTFLRNLATSTLSAVVRPSERRPASRSSCFNQLVIVRRAISYSRATALTVLPERISSRTLDRNSGG